MRVILRIIYQGIMKSLGLIDNLTDAWRAVATGGGAVEPHPVSVLVTILDPRVKRADPGVSGVVLKMYPGIF